MALRTIEEDFKHKVYEQIALLAEGVQRYRVVVPFVHEDGDHLGIVLKQEDGQWLLSDEGNTYMRLTYDIDERDLQRGTRQVIITNALTAFGVQDREGELILPIEDEQYGDAFYSFIQALLKITDVTYLPAIDMKEQPTRPRNRRVLVAPDGLAIDSQNEIGSLEPSLSNEEDPPFGDDEDD